MTATAHVRALCCECGNLRTAARLRRDGNTSFDDGRDPRGWRMTRTLKCSVCKRATIHALLRDDRPDLRDMAEERQQPSREELMSRAMDITSRIGMEDLTVDELRQLVAFLVAADARCNGGWAR